jgi:hypothetical protein
MRSARDSDYPSIIISAGYIINRAREVESTSQSVTISDSFTDTTKKIEFDVPDRFPNKQ